jgi:uncharacterized protein (DUF2249 family)
MTLCLDVRAIAPRDRHPKIFGTFDALPVGGAFELLNDHDPLPLYQQFQARAPGRFEWDYLQAGPDTWRVAIKRTAAGRAADAGSSCCGGGCGG